MPIPPAPTPDQFDQIAKAIDSKAKVVSTRKLLGGLGCRMDVLEMLLGDGTPHKVVTRQYWVKEDRKNDERPIGESSILRALARNGIPVPEPVLTEEAACSIFGRPGLVISFIEGTPNLAPIDPHDYARQLAKTMAKIHLVTVTPELKTIPRSHMISLAKWMSSEEPPKRFVGHDLGVELWNAMRSLWPNVDTSPNQIIHTDFWPGNTLWKDEKLLAIIDWEWPSLGVPADDVGYFLSDAVYAGFDIEKSFLETYEEAMGKPVQDLLFWKMMATAIPMPDVGPWAQGYDELGMRRMSPDEIRRAHAKHVKNLLDEFHDAT